MKRCLWIVFSVICIGICILAFVLRNSKEDIPQDHTIGQSATGKFLIGDVSVPVQRDVQIIYNYTEDKLYHYSHLIIKDESETLTYNLSESDVGSYADLLYVCDIDGDNADEIIIQRTAGMTGGAGQYISQIFKVENNQIKEIFHSSSSNKFDTGFSSDMQDNYMLVIVNRHTGYEKALDISAKGYLDVFYNEEGSLISKTDIFADSFHSFSPVDVDNDGIFEIKANQYVSFYGHSDYIGTAVSILKYRSNTKKFDIIETEFIP